MFCCLHPFIRPRAPRAAKMNKRSWELWWRILRRRRTHATLFFVRIITVGYHDIVEAQEDITCCWYELICLFLMLTDCYWPNMRFFHILAKTKCFLSTSLDFFDLCVISCDHETFVAVGTLLWPWTIQVCPVRVLGGTDNVYGKALGSMQSMEMLFFGLTCFFLS